MEQGLGIQLLMVLAAAAVAVAACRRLGLSPILGYLATGVVTGPAALGWLSDAPTLRLLAEIGVVLLMFTIGLEFSLPRLLAMRRLVLGLGGAQVTLTLAVLGAAAWALGMTPAAAVILGGALAMSSTAIVLKQLGEQMELPAEHGRVATAVLLFQDLAAVPLLVILPILASDQPAMAATLGLALLKAALVFATLLLVGRRLLPPLLSWVAETRSLELFMLTSLLLALTAAGLSHFAGLSATLGAFMAGMLLGETLFRHQIEADIRPFRDIMLGLFFATVGMQLAPATFVQQPLAVLLVWSALVLVKPLLLAPLVRGFGFGPVSARRAAIVLAQGGEFGLLLVSSALGLGLIGNSVAQPLLGGLILSMVSAPLLLRFSGPLAAFPGHGRQPATAGVEQRISDFSEDFDRHVIVCGYGRIGQNLVRLLEDEGVDALALDLDPRRVAQAAAAGENVLYGNVAQPGVLEAAGIARARALALTMDDPHLAARVAGLAHTLSAGLPILARSVHGRDDEALAEAGVEVFPEGLETSLAFAGQLLLMLGIPASQVEARLAAIRAMEYAPLRAFFHASEGNPDEQRDYPVEVRSLVLDEHHPAIGRTPRELGMTDSGVELLDLRRGSLRLPGQPLDTRLRPGDVLILKGREEALERLQARLGRT